MLRELFIQDIVLIDQLRVSLGEGLTALTGETGAGKSIMLDALGLATGARAEKALVRIGAKAGVVSATFEPGPHHPVWAILSENGLFHQDDEADQIILRRVQASDGPARAFINDQPVSVTMLRNIGHALIEVHGQHQGQGFLEPALHRNLLDDYGALQGAAGTVADAWTAWQDLEKSLRQRLADRDAAEREADYLRHVAAELSQLAPEPDEEKALALRRATLMAAEKINAELEGAGNALGDENFETRLAAALARIETIAGQTDPETTRNLENVITRIDGALTELDEARRIVDTVLRDFEFDAQELNEVEERLFALRAAARKYNTHPDQLGAFLEKTDVALALLEDQAADFDELQKRIALAQSQYLKHARALSRKRRAAATKLDKAMALELAPLKLEKATFKVDIATDEDRPGETGIDVVQFLISTNPGTPLGPLKQIASGGELSRFVLALKASLLAKEDRTVIIFDEVDSGVGGAVADAVGERLAILAAGTQVLVVTHSPQVAARASRQLQVTKSAKSGRGSEISSTITLLTPEQRTEEVARMLSGAEITPEARAAAAKLLAGTSAVPGKKQRSRKSTAA